MKLFLFDIDGTLVDGQNQMPESTWKAIEKLREDKHKCFICSGRNCTASHSFSGPEFDGLIYNSGGGIVIGMEDYYQTEIKEDTLAKLLKLLEENEAAYGLYVKEKAYADERMFRAFQEWGEALGNAIEVIFQNYAIAPIAAFKGEKVHKLDVQFPNIQKREQVISHLGEELLWTGPQGGEQGLFGEINIKGITKGSGALRLAEYYGLGKDDLYGFGDGNNDLPLMEACGHSIAMGNGAAKIKEAAEYVTAAVNEDGIAKALCHYGFL